MSEAFGALGLPRDASSREVKRAYARLLKATRPDEDAEAFQRLNEAYRQALSQAERREALATADGGNAGVSAPPDGDGPAAVPADADADADADALAPPPPARPLRDAHAGAARTVVFHVQPFVDAIEDRLGRGGHSLLAWLREQPDLWEIDAKDAIAPATVQALAERGVVLAHEELEALQEFFGLDIRQLHRSGALHAWNHLLQSAEALGLARLRDAGARGAHAGGARHGRTTWFETQAWRELRGPGSRWRRVLMQLLPFGPSRLWRMRRQFIETLGAPAAEPQLDPEASRYWSDAGDVTRHAAARLRLGALRLVALAAAAAGVAWLAGDATPTPATLLAPWPVVAAIAAAWATCGATLRLHLACADWLGARGLPPRLWGVAVGLASILVAPAWLDVPGRGVLAGLVGAITLLAYAQPRHGITMFTLLGAWLLSGAALRLAGLATPGPLDGAALLGTASAIIAVVGLDLAVARRAGVPLAAMAIDALHRPLRTLALALLGLGLAATLAPAFLS